MQKIKANRHSGTTELWWALEGINGTNKVYHANEENEWSGTSLMSWAESQLMRWKKWVGDEPKVLTYANNHWFDEQSERTKALCMVDSWFRPHTDSYNVNVDTIPYGLKRFREQLSLIINNCSSTCTTIVGRTVNNVREDRHIRLFEVFQEDITGFGRPTGSKLFSPDGTYEEFNWQGERLALHKQDLELPNSIKGYKFVTPTMYKEIIALVKREGDWFSKHIHEVNTQVLKMDVERERKNFEVQLHSLAQWNQTANFDKKGMKKKITAYNKKVKKGLEIAALMDEFYCDDGEPEWRLLTHKSPYVEVQGCPKSKLSISVNALKAALNSTLRVSRRLMILAPIAGNGLINETAKKELGIENLQEYYDGIEELIGEA